MQQLLHIHFLQVERCIAGQLVVSIGSHGCDLTVLKVDHLLVGIIVVGLPVVGDLVERSQQVVLFHRSTECLVEVLLCRFGQAGTQQLELSQVEVHLGSGEIHAIPRVVVQILDHRAAGEGGNGEVVTTDNHLLVEAGEGGEGLFCITYLQLGTVAVIEVVAILIDILCGIHLHGQTVVTNPWFTWTLPGNKGFLAATHGVVHILEDVGRDLFPLIKEALYDR